MAEQDGQVPAPRRPVARLRRAGARPEVAPPPRVADLSALLADIDALRTTLSTDLTLAAAALEAGAEDLVSELVSGDLEALHAFESRSLAHLTALDAERPVTVTAGGPDLPAETAAEVLSPAPLRRRWLVQAAPLLAAAAVVGLFAGVVPTSTPVPPGTAVIDELSQASYSLAMLNELAAQGASSDALLDAATDLNEQLAALVEDAAGDPVAAQQALLLLTAGTQVLSEQDDQGPLAGVLARTRALERELMAMLPPRVRSTLPPRTVRPVAPAVKAPELVRSSPRAARASEQPASSPAASPKPSSSPPAPAPAPQPTAGTASPSPTPEPSPPAADPLPRPAIVPGY